MSELKRGEPAWYRGRRDPIDLGTGPEAIHGKIPIIQNGSNVIGNVYGIEFADKLIACYNACADMPNPASEIAVMRKVCEAAGKLESSPSFESCGQIIISTINPAWVKVRTALSEYRKLKGETDGKIEEKA